MSQSIGYLALLVHEYDEAIAFFVGSLGFRLLEDTPLGGGIGTVAVFLDLHGNRWDLVQPAASSPPSTPVTS